MHEGIAPDERIRVGCSGWQYRSWRGRFYPESLPTTGWLDYYAGIFDTVEINNTFYRLPDASAFARWRDATPAGFLVSIKASRYLTHMRKLRQPARPLRRLLTRAARLESRLGPILYQLPAELHVDMARLREFLDTLRRVSASVRQTRSAVPAFQHVVEFRHSSWYTTAVFEALAESDVSLCLHDKAGAATPVVAVGPVTYVRFHGPTGMYRGEYSTRDLRSWASWLAARRRTGQRVFAYFNNDPDAAAARNALALRNRLQAVEA